MSGLLDHFSMMLFTLVRLIFIVSVISSTMLTVSKHSSMKAPTSACGVFQRSCESPASTCWSKRWRYGRMSGASTGSVRARFWLFLLTTMSSWPVHERNVSTLR